MNVIFLLCDTMTRDKLGPYHQGHGRYGHIQTPNLDRLAERSMTFDNHWLNSTPCMPARRDLWSGRIEFPWRSWGPRESFDPDWSIACRDAAVVSALFSDHANLMDKGGENYHLWFDHWDFVRGHYNDHCLSVLPVTAGRPGQARDQYQSGRDSWRSHEDSFVARNLGNVVNWLDDHADRRESKPFFLCIDEFDPHWPLDPPEPYRSMYVADPTSLDQGLPTFYRGGDAACYTEEELAWFQAQCAGKITMVDHSLGQLLDAMDRHQLWDDTMLVVTSDHGEFIGEYDQVSKGTGFSYPLFSRLPLLIAHPAAAPGSRCGGLSCTVDMHSTVLAALGLPVSEHCHGRSLLPLLTQTVDQVRDDLVYGWWGKGFYWTDGRHLLCKAPEQPGPLFQYGTNLGEKHVGLKGQPFDRYASAETGRFLPHTDRPVYRVPSDGMAYNRGDADFDAIFDLVTDPDCLHNRWDDQALRQGLLPRLTTAMGNLQVPAEHYERLGLTNSIEADRA